MSSPEIDFRRIREQVADQFSLGIHSVHGPSHWERVEVWGLRLVAETPGADLTVVRLFALFHDSRRLTEWSDPQHGERGGAFARRKYREWFDCSESQLEVLVAACEGHELGDVSNDPTIGCCWDADRLDLPRVSINPDPEFMSTALGKRLAGRPM
jgi:uncharacterized protein